MTTTTMKPCTSLSFCRFPSRAYQTDAMTANAGWLRVFPLFTNTIEGTHFRYTRVSCWVNTPNILVSAVVGCKHAVGAVEKTVSAVIAHLIATDINQPKDFCMSEQELKAELERLKTENEALKNRGSKAISMKVSEKGGVSIYGLGRFPVTLYREQWLRLLDMADDIRSFIAENESKLKAKE